MRIINQWLRKIGDLSWFAIIAFGLYSIISFAIIFFFLSCYSPGNGLSVKTPDFLISLHFSASVFISLVYGDIVPLGISKFFTIIEGLFGIIFITILISKIVSLRQEKMITKMYQQNYTNLFQDIREETGEHRREMNDLTRKYVNNQKDEELKKEMTQQFNSKRGFFRIMSSQIGGLWGFLKTEKETESIIFKELNVYYFEKIMHTVWITIKDVRQSLIRIQFCKFFLNAKGRGNLRLLLKNTSRLNEWIFKNYKSDDIKIKHKDIKEILRDIEINYPLFLRK